jgi:hypothetical protein
MLTWKILPGLILMGVAGAVMIAGGGAQAQSGSDIGKLSFCQRECAGNPACLRTCGGTASKTKVKVPPPQPDPEPPAVKSWKDAVFGPSANGGGGGGGGGR